MSRSTTIILVLLIIILGAVGIYYYTRPAATPNPLERIDESVMPSVEIESRTAAFRVGTTTIFLEIADDEVERSEGLGNRSTLEGNLDGMLFVFDKPAATGIWMKDMRFALDILWLDESWNIIDMAERVSPQTYPRSFVPKAPAKYVIELEAGRSDELGLKIGDTLKLLALRP